MVFLDLCLDYYDFNCNYFSKNFLVLSQILLITNKFRYVFHKKQNTITKNKPQVNDPSVRSPPFPVQREKRTDLTQHQTIYCHLFNSQLRISCVTIITKIIDKSLNERLATSGPNESKRRPSSGRTALRCWHNLF